MTDDAPTFSTKELEYFWLRACEFGRNEALKMFDVRRSRGDAHAASRVAERIAIEEYRRLTQEAP